jgi:hypothetical protein
VRDEQALDAVARRVVKVPETNWCVCDLARICLALEKGVIIRQKQGINSTNPIGSRRKLFADAGKSTAVKAPCVPADQGEQVDKKIATRSAVFLVVRKGGALIAERGSIVGQPKR